SPPSRCCCGHRSSSSWCSGPCPPLSCARSGGGERKASAAWGHAEGSGVAGAPGTRGGESGRRGAGSRALPTFTALWNIGRFHRTLEHRSVSPLFATRLGLHRTVRAERARRPRLARFHRTSCRPSVPPHVLPRPEPHRSVGCSVRRRRCTHLAIAVSRGGRRWDAAVRWAVVGLWSERCFGVGRWRSERR